MRHTHRDASRAATAKCRGHPEQPFCCRFRFKRVYAKQLLDANECGIMPRHAWSQLPFARWRQSADWFRQHLVVDGPFTV